MKFHYSYLHWNFHYSSSAPVQVITHRLKRYGAEADVRALNMYVGKAVLDLVDYTKRQATLIVDSYCLNPKSQDTTSFTATSAVTAQIISLNRSFRCKTCVA